MNTGKYLRVIMMLLFLVSTCLLMSGCVIFGGDHFLWFG